MTRSDFPNPTETADIWATSSTIETNNITMTKELALGRQEDDSQEDDSSADHGLQPIVGFIGLVAVALGVSGLIDDSGILVHPWWVTLVVASLVGCALVIVRTAQSLRSA